ncbi:MAG: UDP-3-O-(3-hydroxymyristoyl)glucosamine N-acyltransferase [Fimbriiglobus sp.]
MEFTLQEVAALVGGTVVGDASFRITAAKPLTTAGPSELTFLESAKLAEEWGKASAGAAIVPTNFPASEKPVVTVADPLLAFVTIFQQFTKPIPAIPVGLHASAVIDPTATIGANARIGPNVVIGPGVTIGANVDLRAGVSLAANVTLGDDVTLHPHVAIYPGCVLGHRVIIHANTVIGADGYGYRRLGGKHVKVPQLGNVILGDDVEVGACSTIDRGTFGPTIIGDGTKIDNLVMIAHNCTIGKHNLLVSQVGIAGSCVTGDDVVMAGQVGVGDHVNIGEKAMLGARSAVIKDVPAELQMLGAPARPIRDAIKIMMCLDHLPEIRKDVKRIKKQLGMQDEE